jgi:hypothetical protein
VTAGQIARGKATVPGQATGEQSDINPSRF